MTARVNLLPPEIAVRARRRREAGITGAALGGYLVLLLLIYLLKLGAVADARNDREEATRIVQDLQAEVASLAEFAELDRRLTARNDLLAAAMAKEMAWARILNDLALAFPGSSSLLTLEATQVGAATAEVQGAPVLADAVGTIEFSGYTVERYAPGVESAVVKFREVRSFRQPYLTQASELIRNQAVVTGYDGTVRLTDEAFTNRYVEGLPPEAAP